MNKKIILLLSLLCFLCPFLSFPGLISYSYVQPIPIGLGMLGIFYLNPKFFINKNILLFFLVYIFYITLTSIFFNSTIDISLIRSYFIGFIQFLFILSFWKNSNQKIKELFIDSLALITIITFLSVVIEYLLPGIFDNFRSRTFEEYQNFLTRGPSGILPEAGYFGPVAGSLFFSFFIGKLILMFEKYKEFFRINKDFLVLYKKYCFYILNLTISRLTILSLVLGSILSFSITSIITIIIYFAVIFSPFIYYFLKFKIPIKVVTYLLIFISIFFVGFSNKFFLPDTTRLYKLIETISNRPQEAFQLLTVVDQSGADRANSSKVGLMTPFISPLGTGLNGMRRLVDSCDESITKTLSLLCESKWNTRRNHNSLANFTQDGGLVGIYFLLLLISPDFKIKKLFNLNYPLKFLSFSFILMGIIIPSPIGLSNIWLSITLIQSINTNSLKTTRR